MKRSLIVVLGIMLAVLTVIGTTALANKSEDEKQYNLKLIYESKYVLDEKLNENSKVIIEYDNQKIDDFNIMQNEKITLETLDIPEDKVINYWQIQEVENRYVITPVVVAKNEVSINFATTNGGKLVDKAILPSITKTVETGTMLSEIIPDVQNEEGFYFAGWFTIENNETKSDLEEQDQEDVTALLEKLATKEDELSKEEDEAKKKELETSVTELKREIELKTESEELKKLRAERSTKEEELSKEEDEAKKKELENVVKAMTEEMKLKKREKLSLEELQAELEIKENEFSKEKDEGKQKQLENVVIALKKEIEAKTELEEQNLTEKEIVNEYQIVQDIGNIELDVDKEYIAVLYPDVNGNEKDDRKEKINLGINFGLDNEVIQKEIHVGQPIKLSQPYHEDYIFIDWFIDSGFKERFDHEAILTEDTSIFAQWKTAEQVVSESGDNLIDVERISDKVETYLDEQNKKTYEQLKKESEEKAKKLKEKFEQDLAKHSEKRYTLKNFNVKQSFLIKFYDNENFLFSVALPYGRTLELVNEDGNKIKEYGIRQESSIDLNELINNSNALEFDIKTIKKNNAVITQIYPKNNTEEMD